MVKSNAVSMLRGRLMRATVLDASGRPVYGDSSVVTTKGFITASITTNTEEGEAISVTNANGETCVSEPASPTFSGFSAEVEFCNVDFALFEVLTGQPVVTNSDGVIVGITESTAVDLTAVNFALELWMGATSNAAPSAGGQGKFGYMLLPFVGGGVVGDVTIENAAITFTVTGMNTKDGSNWGAGPHLVELVAGVPAVLSTPMKSKDHRRTQIVEVSPPEVLEGATPLLDPAGTAVTAITATATGLSVAISPTPAGTGAMWYTFGDGQWDYSETGSYVHVYDAPGTYTITGRRGKTSASKAVTVTNP